MLCFHDLAFWEEMRIVERNAQLKIARRLPPLRALQSGLVKSRKLGGVT